MAQGKYLQDDLINLGEVKRDAIIDFKIKLRQDNKYAFQYNTKQCGCTVLKSSKEDILDTGEIEVQFNVKHSVPSSSKKEQINKVVMVYFDDGQPDFIANENGVRVMNPQKTIERFTITGFALPEEDNNNKD